MILLSTLGPLIGSHQKGTYPFGDWYQCVKDMSSINDKDRAFTIGLPNIRENVQILCKVVQSD